MGTKKVKVVNAGSQETMKVAIQATQKMPVQATKTEVVAVGGGMDYKVGVNVAETKVDVSQVMTMTESGTYMPKKGSKKGSKKGDYCIGKKGKKGYVGSYSSSGTYIPVSKKGSKKGKKCVDLSAAPSLSPVL